MIGAMHSSRYNYHNVMDRQTYMAKQYYAVHEKDFIVINARCI